MGSNAELFDDPRNLITDDHIKTALKNDGKVGKKIKSWNTNDFTNRGDNYSSFVTSVKVQLENEEEVSYIAKTNPCRDSEGWNGFIHQLFTREGLVLSTLVPEFNEVLVGLNERPLPMPKCYLMSLESKKEALILEDLRQKEFVMAKRQVGLDFVHSSLIMKEFAKLHACSHIQEMKSQKHIAEMYPFIEKAQTEDEDNMCYKMHVAVFSGQLRNMSEILKEIGQYEEAMTIVDKMNVYPMRWYNKQVKAPKSQKFRAVCHGDCWTNNFLFKYDDENKPIEAMLLDLQYTRISSLATDLNHFMFSSVACEKGPRLEHITKLLEVYYSQYKNLIEKANLEMPFTFEELTVEFHIKNLFGFLMAVVMLPISSLNDEDLMDVESMKDDRKTSEATMERFEKLLNIVKSESPFRKKFLCLSEEIKLCHRQMNFFTNQH